MTDIAINRCATAVLEVIPLVMRTIRSEMRGARAPDLSVPQFRALAFIGRHAGASLGDVAEHLGLMLPAASTIINGLVANRLARRATPSDDRRRVALGLTAAGEKRLTAMRKLARQRLALRLAKLSPADRTRVTGALETLRGIFSNEHEIALRKM